VYILHDDHADTPAVHRVFLRGDDRGNDDGDVHEHGRDDDDGIGDGRDDIVSAAESAGGSADERRSLRMGDRPE